MIGRKSLKSHQPIVIYSLWVGFHLFETYSPQIGANISPKDLLVKMIQKPLSKTTTPVRTVTCRKTMRMVLLAMLLVFSPTGPFSAMDFWHLLVDHVPSLVAAGDLGRKYALLNSGDARNLPWKISNQPRLQITKCFVNLWIVRMECLDMFGRLQYILPLSWNV